MKKICLIPAKGCSTRLPRKNILPLNGHPMIAYAIRKAFKSKIFDEICVSTEDLEIAEIAKKYGAHVPFNRPDNLSRDPSTIVDVMLHALEFYQNKGEVFEQMTVLLPTAPFVNTEDIVIAHKLFEKSNADALMSITKTEFPPFNAWLIDNFGENDYLKPCFPNSPYKYTKSTECPKTYRSNGAILMVNIKPFIENRGYQGSKIIPYVMPLERSLDIDTEYEYMFAKYLMDTNYFEDQQEVFL